MNKKHSKSLFFFLSLFMIMIVMTTVSAVETNDTSLSTDVSDDSVSQSVDLTEKTSNDISINNNNQKSSDDNLLDTQTGNAKSDVKTKSIQKTNKTVGKEVILGNKTVLTLGSTKTVYVGDNICIYGKLTSNSKNLANATVRLVVAGQFYEVNTTQYGNYKTYVSVPTNGTKTIFAYYLGTRSYQASYNYTNVKVVMKPTNLTVGCTQTTSVGNTISIYGRLSARGIGLPYKTVQLDVGGSQYNVTTSQYGNYNIKVFVKNPGRNYVTATYDGTNIYTYDIAVTSFVANSVNVITVGSTKSVYVGDKVSVYGKLTANGINVANANITIFVDNAKYTTTTSQYGNFNIKVTPSSAGNKTVTVIYAGTNAYNSVNATTTFQAVKKVTNLTIGSTKIANVGDNVTVYGKISARNIGLPYKTLNIKVNGVQYNVTTSQYGNYKFSYVPNVLGIYYISVSYAGTNIYTSNRASTFFVAY